MTTATPPATSDAPAPSPPSSGLFISFEGGDGADETTQIRIFADPSAAAGVDHVFTHEPGGTELGVEIRRLLLRDGHVASRAEALLYVVGHAHHITIRVRPALERGAVVLVDRYLGPSVAYQGVARSLGPQEVRDLSLRATEGLLLDLTILLGGDSDLVERRAIGHDTRDHLGQEGDALRVVLREQLFTLAEGEPERFVVVDVNRPIDQVADDVIGAVVAAVHRYSVRLAYDGAHQDVPLGLEAFMEAAVRHSTVEPDMEVCS